MKKTVASLIFFTVLINAWLLVSFTTSNTIKYKPVKNFDWLGEYHVFSKTVTTEGWTQSKQMSLDSAGVVQYENKKNPCTISEFALALYNRYIQTNDEQYKKQFLNQVRWLIDPRNYQVIKNDMLGHPYNYVFHDLNPPWYGGLAEAEFISVLIRYYAMTKDEKVLPLIIKTRNFLFTPEAEGGLLARTPEGNVWIEEYGGSRQERHVLNGFFVTVISLYEYCRLFPGDKEANDIYIQCLESIKKSLKYYERQNWVTYNRGDFRLVINWYMKAQVIELEELYRISKDEFFRHQAMLWSTYVYEKPIGRPPGTCLIDNYNFSVPVINENGVLKPQPTYTNILNSGSVVIYQSSEGLKKDSLRSLTDGNIATKVSLYPDQQYPTPIFIDFTFDTEKVFNAISIVSDQPENIPAIKFILPDSQARLNPLNVSAPERIANYLVYNCEKTSSRRFRFQIEEPVKENVPRFNEIRLHNTDETQQPLYSHYSSDVFETKSDKITLAFDTTDIADPIIYYKSTPDRAGIDRAIWTQEKFFKGTLAEIPSGEDRFFKFLVIYKIKSKSSAIRNVVIK